MGNLIGGHVINPGAVLDRVISQVWTSNKFFDHTFVSTKCIDWIILQLYLYVSRQTMMTVCYTN